jgi:hypothetical protein
VVAVALPAPLSFKITAISEDVDTDLGVSHKNVRLPISVYIPNRDRIVRDISRVEINNSLQGTLAVAQKHPAGYYQVWLAVLSCL